MLKRLKFSISKVGIVTKHHQPEARDLAIKIANLCLSKRKRVVVTRDDAHISKKLNKSAQIVDRKKLPEVCDLIVVIGGDGTFLAVARLMEKRSIPILGINTGQLGFLTEIKKSEAIAVVSNLLDESHASISERALMEVTLKRGKRTVYKGPVVNDVVVSKGAIARIIGVTVFVNDREVTTVRADGVIVSTPTGSTAYSLAAGGPILEPNLPALIITPICPHSVTHRPVIVPDRMDVKLQLNHRPGHVLLTLDGQDALTMKEGDCVEVKMYRKHKLLIVSSPDRDYFDLLREKFKFGMRA